MEGASSGGIGVEGAATAGARLGSLWEDDEGTKIVSHSSLVVSEMVRAPLPDSDSSTDPKYTSQQQ